jgi:holo-[acyl-carrier protein] synthase
MIIGIGIDLVEVSRIREALAKEGFREKVFSGDEIAYCESKKAHAAESYAGRYAVKEAVGKALGTGIRPEQLEKVETLPDASGIPQVHLLGQMLLSGMARNVRHIHVSISHTAEWAVAQVILED